MPDLCWYERVARPADGILQGQLLLDVHLSELGFDDKDEARYSFVILTHSCDAPRIERLLLARVRRVAEYNFSKGIMNDIGKGRTVRYHMLPPDAEFGITDFLICDLADLLVVPKDDLERYFDGKVVIRLVTPYIEHLGYAVGRSFSRVGLEQDVSIRSDWRW